MWWRKRPRVDTASAVATLALAEYQRWLEQQCCRGCHAKYSDRVRDINGRPLEWWISEDWCGCPAGRPAAHGNRTSEAYWPPELRIH